MQVTESVVLKTPRLDLVCCTKEMLEALLESEASLANILNINIPENWTEFGERAFRFTYNKIVNEDEKIEWWTYLPILKTEKMLVGSCGFKGEPERGIVEIGYEVAQNYRCGGLGTEIAEALIKFAFRHETVLAVQAHTLAVSNESCRVLKKCGMKKVGDIDDPNDGQLWRWEIRK